MSLFWHLHEGRGTKPEKYDGEFDGISGVALEALALELMNDRYIENGCGCMDIYAGIDGEAMHRKPL